MDNNLIFLHLPKNGGTTFNSLLNRLYPRENTFTIKSLINSKTNEEEFTSMCDSKRAKIQLVKGHALFGLHQYMAEDTKYITFLRKPDNRIPSAYHHVLRNPNNRLYNKIIDNKMSLYEFITQVKSSELNNCQVRWISGIEDKEEFMLEKALENIDQHFSFVGITEKYNESLILIQSLYNWSTPYYMSKNKDKNRPLNLEIDEKTLAAINYYNSADNQLYNIIYEKLTEKIKSESFMNLKLAKLKVLNKMYSNETGRKIAGTIKRTLS